MRTNFIAQTFPPPYYAVIFTSVKSEYDNYYSKISTEMLQLASQQNGFLGVESVRDELYCGITVSYWESLESINAWKENSKHKEATQREKLEWYLTHKTRICLVEKEY